MTGTPTLGGDRVRRVRLTRLLAYDIAANIASLLLLAAVWLWVRRSPAVGLLAGLVAAHLLVDLALLRRRSPAQDRSTVAVLTASTWLITLAVAPVVPAVLPILALTSLYPASTIVLARILLGERLTRLRLTGLALAGACVALIAAGGAG